MGFKNFIDEIGFLEYYFFIYKISVFIDKKLHLIIS